MFFLNKSSSTKIGYSFTLGFKISLHENGRGILESIKTFFGIVNGMNLNRKWK